MKQLDFFKGSGDYFAYPTVGGWILKRDEVVLTRHRHGARIFRTLSAIVKLCYENEVYTVTVKDTDKLADISADSVSAASLNMG